MTTDLAPTTNLVSSPKNRPKYAKDEDREYVGDPWARQPKESKKAYGAFRIYLDLGDKRTIAEADRRYRAQQGLPPCETPRLCPRWSSNHRWVERATAYDNFIDAKTIAANKRKAIRAAEKHAEQASQVQEVLMQPVDEYRKRLAEHGVPQIIQDLDDVNLLKLVAAFGKDLPAMQKAERDALNSTSSTVVAPAQVKAKGEVVRRILARPDLIGLMESLSFEMTATEEPSEES